jgi:hypothetical protein
MQTALEMILCMYVCVRVRAETCHLCATAFPNPPHAAVDRSPPVCDSALGLLAATLAALARPALALCGAGGNGTCLVGQCCGADGFCGSSQQFCSEQFNCQANCWRCGNGICEGVVEVGTPSRTRSLPPAPTLARTHAGMRMYARAHTCAGRARV